MRVAEDLAEEELDAFQLAILYTKIPPEVRKTLIDPYVSIDWFDNSVFPPVLMATGDTMVDSLFYANAYTGGYQISVMDTNGCETDTIIYVHPDNADATFGVGSVDSIPPTCFNSCDCGTS